MRTYHKVLAHAKRDRKQGNHKVEFVSGDYVRMYTDNGDKYMTLPDTITRIFIYHSTIICAVDDTNKQFYLSHGGWFRRSTNEALAGYRDVLSNQGYENINNIAVWSYEK